MKFALLQASVYIEGQKNRNKFEVYWN